MSHSGVKSGHDAPLAWYIALCEPGHERATAQRLLERVERYGLNPRIPQVLAPSRKTTHIRRGRREASRETFGGFLLVQIAMDEVTRQLVLSCSSISGFLTEAVLSEDELNRHMDELFNRGSSRP